MHIGLAFLVIIGLIIAPLVTPQALARFATFAAICIFGLGLLVAHPWTPDTSFVAGGQATFAEGAAWAAFATWAFLRGLAWVFGARFGGGWD